MFNQPQPPRGVPSPLTSSGNEKFDWKKIVEESKGRLVFLPEKLIPVVKEWNESRHALKRAVDELSEIEVRTRVMLENMVLKIREYYAEAGDKEIWPANIGMETNALKEGIYVVSIQRENQI